MIKTWFLISGLHACLVVASWCLSLIFRGRELSDTAIREERLLLRETAELEQSFKFKTKIVVFPFHQSLKHHKSRYSLRVNSSFQK